jgi:hypothetical protein
MASRSSAGIGVGITITLLGVACLGLFVATIIFLSKYKGLQQTHNQLSADTEVFVKSGERNSDAVQRYKDLARKDGRSVIGYLGDSLRQAMDKVSGSPGDTVEQMQDKMGRIEGASANNLTAVIAARDSQIASLQSRFEQADKDRKTALTDLGNEQERVKKLQAEHQKTVDGLNADIGKYRAEVEAYRGQVDEAKVFMDRNMNTHRENAASAESALKEQLRTMTNENLQLKEQVAELRGKNAGEFLRPAAEETLVDATIIGLNQSNNQATISRGTRDKVILGMSFAVYSDATAIKIDPRTGDYPRPKAKLEVINVGETSSTCRITEETRGNPVVRGDVVANAIYDPSKVYTFVVYGNFDSNGDGVATPGEADDIRALIAGWGGKTTDELTGNVDFLILGQKPPLPPKPGVDSPDAVLDDWVRLNGITQKYGQLQSQAVSTSVPILNENRLYTLIGRKLTR